MGGGNQREGDEGHCFDDDPHVRARPRPDRPGRHRDGEHRGQYEYTDEEADLLLEHGAAAQVDQMLTYSAIGTATEVREAVQRFAKQAEADELIVAHQSPTPAARLRSVELLAEAMTPARS